jgi:hypothetical protein
VAPGVYNVQLGRRVNGTTTPLGSPQRLEVVRLATAPAR